MAQDSALGSAGGTAREEDGGRAFGINIGRRNARFRNGSGREHLGALDLGGKGHELLPYEDGGNVKFHAAAYHGHFRQGGREIHGHISGRSDGQEQFHGILAVAVENGNVGALGKAQALDKGTAAGNSLSQLLVGDGVGHVGNGRILGIFLGEPVYKLTHGGQVRKAFNLFLGKQGIEILFVGHKVLVLVGSNKFFFQFHIKVVAVPVCPVGENQHKQFLFRVPGGQDPEATVVSRMINP